MTETLTNSELTHFVALRRDLHRRPELSGQEHVTARVIAEEVGQATDEVITGLGGTGVAAVISGAEPGPTVMIRSELDALPIEETSGAEHASEHLGIGHLCGHDGHSVILCALARMLKRRPPIRGRVVLLFQPAEETGAGAPAVLADPRFAALRPDYAFALHNLAGMPLGSVAVRPGPMACASRGMQVMLHGATAHAAMPETGRSPMQALAHLMPAIAALGPGGPLKPGFRLSTISHARLGEAAFGISPGMAELRTTLRTLRNEDMAEIVTQAETLVRDAAHAEGLGHDITYTEVFAHCDNDPEATAILTRAFEATGVTVLPDPGPMRWSEDFGQFGQVAKAAMFLLGAGEDHPQLHNSDYDFPDDLIPVGAAIFAAAIRDVLG